VLVTAEIVSHPSSNYTPRLALLELIARVDQIHDITCVITLKDGMRLEVVRSETTQQDVAAAAVWLNDYALQLLKA